MNKMKSKFRKFIKKHRSPFFKKKNSLYIVFTTLLLLMTAFLSWYFTISLQHIPFQNEESFPPSQAKYIAGLIFCILNCICIYYFWINGLKDLLYVIWFNLFKRLLFKKYEKIANKNIKGAKDKVLLVYCTCNDFNDQALYKSMQQDWKYFDVVILDDSKNPEYIKQVNKFAKQHNIKVVRRENSEGFKAGNINNYLKSQECRNKNYDYFVILDSDEIIPHNFIEECLKYFYTFTNVGVVQANHISNNNKNAFMSLFHHSVNSHFTTYLTMKSEYGFHYTMGHGVMIKKDVYELVNGFPHVVAEDIAFSVEVREKNYLSIFAPNIVCEEEFPINYAAFKKRHRKWMQGNLEFMKKYFKKVSVGKAKWFEKMDVYLFTYNLPIVGIIVFGLLINFLVLPILGVKQWELFNWRFNVVWAVIFFSPLFNDIFTYALRMNPFKLIWFLFWTTILYGSMFLTTVVVVFSGLFGKKAMFIVTPKDNYKFKFLDIFRLQWRELLLTVIMVTISLLIFNSILPAIMVGVPATFSIFLIFFSNIEYTPKKMKRVDEQSHELINSLTRFIRIQK